MAKTTFTDEELKKPLFFEIIRYPEGPSGNPPVVFHGFYSEETLLRSRSARESITRVQMWRNGVLKTSDYLYFLAQMFAEIESQNLPASDNPCSEVLMMSEGHMTNLRDTTCPHTGQPCSRGCFDLHGMLGVVCTMNRR